MHKRFMINFPSRDKLYTIAKREGLKAAHKQIAEFLEKHQVARAFKPDSTHHGYIVAFHPQ